MQPDPFDVAPVEALQRRPLAVDQCLLCDAQVFAQSVMAVRRPSSANERERTVGRRFNSLSAGPADTSLPSILCRDRGARIDNCDFRTSARKLDHETRHGQGKHHLAAMPLRYHTWLLPSLFRAACAWFLRAPTTSMCLSALRPLHLIPWSSSSSRLSALRTSPDSLSPYPIHLSSFAVVPGLPSSTTRI